MSAVQVRPATRLSLVSLGFLLVFFVSGFTALLYQIIWQRLLTLFGGADVYSVTIIVASYMAGLGFGSLAGGYLADRLTTRSRLMAFAGCELAIALFAAFSVSIYYNFLYGWLGSWPMPRGAMAAIIFAVTLWPTVFMGMSLPLLATALTHDARQPARWVPILYGVNTVGAGCGSLFAAAILFRAFDFATSLRIGALLSFGCALAALACTPVAARRWTNRDEASTPSAHPPTVNDTKLSPQPIRLPAWVAIYALSGFVALSLEIVWFRVLGVMLKSNSFTFGHLLGLYLLGVGFGSLIGESARAQARPPARAFFILQAAIPIVAALGLLLVLVSLDRVPGTEPLWRYLGQYETLTRGDILG
jgi:spermidine synthase